MRIKDILVDNKINKEKILCEIWQNVNENSIAEDYYLKDEVSIIIRYLSEHYNLITKYIWGILFKLPVDEAIMAYCVEKIEKISIEEQGLNRHEELNYILRKSNIKQYELIEKWLQAKDIYMQHVAQEALAKYDMLRAFKLMVDLYENIGVDHEIRESIELWITYNRNSDIDQYIDERGLIGIL